MMKRLFLVFGCCLCLFCSGCSFVDTTTKREATDYDYVNIYEIQSQITKVIDQVDDACIGIYNDMGTDGSATGSGVIFKKEENVDLFGNERYYAVTNYHVIEGNKYLKAYLGRDSYGDIFLNAKYLGGDKDLDVAVISFETTRVLGICEFGLADNVSRGEFVIAIGCPLKFTLFNTATLGIVSNINSDSIQHDTAINPGNSGGGLFNLNGRLIGLNNSKYMSTSDGTSIEGIGFAISIEVVDGVINRVLNKTEAPATPKLEITVVEYNTFKAYYGSDEILSKVPTDLSSGLVVMTVNADGVGYKAGIKMYDVIVKADSIDIRTTSDFTGFLSGKKSGDSITITVNRNGELVELTCLLS